MTMYSYDANFASKFSQTTLHAVVNVISSNAATTRDLARVALGTLWQRAPLSVAPAAELRRSGARKDGSRHGPGEASRSIGYVDSLAYGILLAATSLKAAGSTYWLADERPYPMYEVVDTVRKVLREDFGMKVSARTLFVPGVVADVARLADRTIQSLGAYNQHLHVLSEMNLTIACVIDKAKRELSYRPLVGLREGMRMSVEWCLSHNVSI